MKRLTLILLLSLGLNLALAAWWMGSRSPTVEVPPAQAADPTPVAARLPTKNSAKKSGTPASALPASAPAPGIRSWQDLQTDDLKEFVTRLRAAGCPEETVQDLILAEVNRRYTARVRDLYPDRYKERPYWEMQKNDLAEMKKNREANRKSQEMQKEKSAELVALLGLDPEKERRKEDGMEDAYNWMESRVSFLPESKREAALKYLDDFEEKRQEFYQRNRGLYDAQYRSEQRELEAEQLRGLSQILSPQELREFELRQSQVASQLTFDLRGIALTRAQYESIFDVRKKYGDSIYNYGDIETAEGRQKVEDTKKSMQLEIAALVGPEKATEYQRSQDYSYQQLVQLASRSDLPVSTAGKVYDYKEAAEQTAKQLKEDKTLSPEQRQAALLQVRAETEKTVKEALGEKNYKRYLQQGGWWLNNIAPAAPTRPRPTQ